MILFGAVAFNLLEVFWVVDPDMRKNANLECTLFARLLHMVSTELPRPLPRHWSMQVDNATAEGKNQTVAKFMAWLTWKKLFDSTELTEFSVGPHPQCARPEVCRVCDGDQKQHQHPSTK